MSGRSRIGRESLQDRATDSLNGYRVIVTSRMRVREYNQHRAARDRGFNTIFLASDRS